MPCTWGRLSLLTGSGCPMYRVMNVRVVKEYHITSNVLGDISGWADSVKRYVDIDIEDISEPKPIYRHQNRYIDHRNRDNKTKIDSVDRNRNRYIDTEIDESTMKSTYWVPESIYRRSKSTMRSIPDIDISGPKSKYRTSKSIQRRSNSNIGTEIDISNIEVDIKHRPRYIEIKSEPCVYNTR